mgnify:FL=1
MFPRHHWRGSIEALSTSGAWGKSSSFRAIIGAAPLKRARFVRGNADPERCFRAIIGAAPLKPGLVETPDVGFHSFRAIIGAAPLKR